MQCYAPTNEIEFEWSIDGNTPLSMGGGTVAHMLIAVLIHSQHKSQECRSAIERVCMLEEQLETVESQCQSASAKTLEELQADLAEKTAIIAQLKEQVYSGTLLKDTPELRNQDT